MSDSTHQPGQSKSLPEQNLIARESSGAGPWFDPESGILDRRVFSDADIYQRELTHIFARAWNFVCHESQITDTAAFF